MLALVVIALRIALLILFPRGHVALGSVDRCAADGISTAAGREGVCTRVNRTGKPATYNVVDRGDALRMPEYEARLLGAKRITTTFVTRASEWEGLYRVGRDQLVSFMVALRNTGTQPLQLSAGMVQPGQVNPNRPMIELGLPHSTEAAVDWDYPAVAAVPRSPSPSSFLQQPLLPGQRVVGWVNFLMPARWLRMLSVRPTDVDFVRSDRSESYIGQIRLWK